MRGSLLVLIVSFTFSYGSISISEQKDIADAKHDNLQLDYLALAKNMNEQNVLNKQWQKKQKSSRRLSKRQAPPEWILRAAAMGNNSILVKAYIPLVSNIDDTDPAGWSAMMLAAQRGYLDIVKLLLDNGANVNHLNFRSENALMATRFLHKDVVIELIDRGINVNQQDQEGWSAMMRAAKDGLLDIVKLLLDNGANVNHLNFRSENALMWATHYQHKDVVIELIDRGINVNQQEEKGITALMSAAIMGSTELTNILMDAGSNNELKDIFNRTALIYASKSGKTAVMDIHANFENINQVDIYGLSPIHHAVLVRNDLTTLEEGLTHCPDLTLRDVNGNTAEKVAIWVYQNYHTREAFDAIQRHKRELANGCWLDYEDYAAITKTFFDCREFQCHCYGNWTSTGKDDPSCAPKTVNVYSLQEMIAPWIANLFSLTTQSPGN